MYAVIILYDYLLIMVLEFFVLVLSRHSCLTPFFSALILIMFKYLYCLANILGSLLFSVHLHDSAIIFVGWNNLIYLHNIISKMANCKFDHFKDAWRLQQPIHIKSYYANQFIIRTKLLKVCRSD